MPIHRLYMLLILSVFFISSCATKAPPLFVEKKKEDLVKTFDLSKKKKFKKFKVVELSKKSVLRIKQKIRNKSKKKKKGSLKEVVVKKMPSYPEDYPKLFPKYDLKSRKIWEQFSPFFYENESFTLSVSYLGITAGHIKMQSMPMANIGGRDVFHFHAQLQSAKYYEYIYSLDDSVDSYVDIERFLPLKYELVQRESGQSVDDLQIFDHENLKTFHWYKRLKKGKTKNVEKNKYIPKYFQDLFSSLYFARGLPLKVGDEYEFPVVTRTKVWIMKLKVERTEEIEVNGKKVSSIRLNAVTHFPGILKKKGAILFWFSNDPYRKILKFEAKIKLGTIKGELLDYKSGTQKFVFKEPLRQIRNL